MRTQMYHKEQETTSVSRTSSALYMGGPARYRTRPDLRALWWGLRTVDSPNGPCDWTSTVCAPVVLHKGGCGDHDHSPPGQAACFSTCRPTCRSRYPGNLEAMVRDMEKRSAPAQCVCISVRHHGAYNALGGLRGRQESSYQLEKQSPFHPQFHPHHGRRHIYPQIHHKSCPSSVSTGRCQWERGFIPSETRHGEWEGRWLPPLPPPPSLGSLRPCPSYSRHKDRINLVPNFSSVQM